jgi:hypothetical protein
MKSIVDIFEIFNIEMTIVRTWKQIKNLKLKPKYTKASCGDNHPSQKQSNKS